MKVLFSLLAATALTLGTVSCDKDDDDNPPPPNPNTTFTATLDGASEVPANASTATGTATLVFNNDTKTFTIAVNHTIATPTDAHIHVGAAGVSGPPVFPFITFTSPITYTSVALTTDQEADLMANLYYVNIHTAAFTGGEIRGQLIKQ